MRKYEFEKLEKVDTSELLEQVNEHKGD